MGFMQCGAKVIIELLVIFIRKKIFPFDIFINFTKGKIFLLAVEIVVISVILSPALHKAPFRCTQHRQKFRSELNLYF